MGVFDGIEHVAAEGASARQYFEPGTYSVAINSVFLHNRRLGGGPLFVVETTVLESNNQRIRPGDRCNWVQSFALPSALPRIKTFIGAALGLCPKRQNQEINAQVTAEVCTEVVGPSNPLCGKRLALSCISKITRAGKDFVQHSWGVEHG